MVNFFSYCKQLKSKVIHGEMEGGWVIIINETNEREQMYWAKNLIKQVGEIWRGSAGSTLLFCVFTDSARER